MNIFTTPDWESSKIDDKNAKSLCSVNVNQKKFKHEKLRKTHTLKKNKIKNTTALKLKSKNCVLKSKIANKSVEGNSKHNRNSDSIQVSNASFKTKKQIKKRTISVNENHSNNEKLTKIHVLKKNKVKNNTTLKLENNKCTLENKILSKIKERNRRKHNKNDNVNVKKIQQQISASMNENIEGNKILSGNKIENNEKLIKKFNKQKMTRLKKKNKLMENFKSNASEHLKNKTSRINKNKPNNILMKSSKVKVTTIGATMKQTDEVMKESNEIHNKRTKLINLLSCPPKLKEAKKKTFTLKERMLEKLKASRFRYINEQIYNSESKDAKKFFRNDPDAFFAYHEGYRQQVSKWPLNPLDVIIKNIKKMPIEYIVADFGCGDANLAQSVPHKVHSFDLVSINEHVTVCDMSHVPLERESVNVVVFCLSLMGTNIREYLFEANRVLKNGGILKIAEVESRFDTVDVFIEGVKQFGFASIWKDLSHNLFYFLDFKKISKCKPMHKLPTIGLHPCFYKKR